jgi:hypothetical protein
MSDVVFKSQALVFQNAGTTMQWGWWIGDWYRYYSFSARPGGANCEVSIISQSASSDNLNNQTTNMFVNVQLIPPHGVRGLQQVQFTYIRAPN